MSILALIIAVVALCSAYVPRRWNVVLAFLAMLAAFFSSSALTDSSFQSGTLVMWGTCAVIVLVINMGLPKKTVHSRRGVAYLATGAIAGAAIGLAISQTWLALGAVLGLVLGCVAYVGTPAGRDLSAKPKRILNLLCEKGLPTVITVTISVIAIFWSLIVITQS